MEIEELLKKEKIENDQDVEDMMTFMMKNNTREYTKLKLLEELAEFSEVLLKSINKSPQRQPSREDIIGEAGDVLLRTFLFMETFKNEDEVFEDLIDAHIMAKMNRFLGYLKEGKYHSGL